jgi:hypothetical protein
MTPNRPALPPDQARPLAQLKRNLVQLLGILSFEDIAVGDQVREHGGIQLLLSLTEVDEANPCESCPDATAPRHGMGVCTDSGKTCGSMPCSR